MEFAFLGDGKYPVHPDYVLREKGKVCIICNVAVTEDELKERQVSHMGHNVAHQSCRDKYRKRVGGDYAVVELPKLRAEERKWATVKRLLGG